MATRLSRVSVAARDEQSRAERSASLGFYLAILTAVTAAVFAVAAVPTPARSGPFCQTACVAAPYTAVAQFVPGDYFWLIPGILLAPVYVALVACIYSRASESRKAFGLIALSFAVAYGIVIGVDYFVQLTVVAPSLQSGELQDLSLFTQYNPHGFFIALEVLAYMAMSASFLAAAPLFGSGRIELAVRWIFSAGFVLAVAAFAGLWLIAHDLVAVEVSLLMVDWAVLIVGGSLLAIVFRRPAPHERNI